MMIRIYKAILMTHQDDQHYKKTVHGCQINLVLKIPYWALP